MALTEDQALNIMEKPVERGNFTVALHNKKRRDKLQKLLMAAEGESLSGDVWEAVSYFIKNHKDPIQEAEEEKDKSDKKTNHKSDFEAKRKKATDPEFLGRE